MALSLCWLVLVYLLLVSIASTKEAVEKVDDNFDKGKLTILHVSCMVYFTFKIVNILLTLFRRHLDRFIFIKKSV